MLRVYEQSAFIKGILCFKYFFSTKKKPFALFFLDLQHYYNTPYSIPIINGYKSTD